MCSAAKHLFALGGGVSNQQEMTPSPCTVLLIPLFLLFLSLLPLFSTLDWWLEPYILIFLGPVSMPFIQRGYNGIISQVLMSAPEILDAKPR